ncbi:hypothetical protein D1831_07415 [Lactiplantibacillus garii]|uniref:Uncharacterized protein n=1 Tax=Lactiplantibacillus garii TaxID=2306423 RepID=A0A3R8J7E1_9LACO|nr:hypothetical protein [Lactiplantibacillus garii]RRK10482.1 hypothetical protein D1831_07415 [Lactiplantibacillus garii]
MPKYQWGLKIIGTLAALYSAFILLINAFANIAGPGYQLNTGQLMIWIAGILVLLELLDLWQRSRPLNLMAFIISLITIFITLYVQLRVFDVPDIPTIVGVILLSLVMGLLTCTHHQPV